jgi:predicted nucleotidyltransferase component of viral defense system
MNEGLLRKLEASRFNRNFILKGGFLLSSMLENLGRTTRDLDFLGMEIGNDVAGMKDVFTEICSKPSDECLVFLTEQLDASEIKEDNAFSGNPDDN